MIPIERRVDIDDATYRVVSTGLDPQRALGFER